MEYILLDFPEYNTVVDRNQSGVIDKWRQLLQLNNSVICTTTESDDKRYLDNLSYLLNKAFPKKDITEALMDDIINSPEPEIMNDYEDEPDFHYDEKTTIDDVIEYITAKPVKRNKL